MVVKAKMQKTVVVAVERLVRHAVYRKTIKRTSTFMAHDEKGAKQGDTRAHRGDAAAARAHKRWRVEEILHRAPASRTPPRAGAWRRTAMIQMRTILDVADNSGARKHLLHPAPGRLHRPLRGPGRHHHRQRQGVGARRAGAGEEGQGGEGGDRALRQGAPAPRRLLHPLRPERGRADQRRRASRWARACSGRWRASCATRSS